MIRIVHYVPNSLILAALTPQTASVYIVVAASNGTVFKKNLYQSQFTNRKQIEKEVVKVTERKQLFFQRKSTEQIT